MDFDVSLEQDWNKTYAVSRSAREEVSILFAKSAVA